MGPLIEFRDLAVRGLSDWRASAGEVLFSRTDEATLAMIALLGLSVVVALIRTIFGRRQGRSQITLPALMQWVTPSSFSWLRHTPLMLALAGIPFFALALADPHTMLRRQEVSFPGRRIAVMVDASSSMVASFQSATLNADGPSQATFFTAVAATETFIRQRMSGKYRDLIALIEFGDEAYVVTPFTSDYGNILFSLSLVGDWTEFMKFPSQGTTIGKAVEQSVALFKTFDFLDASGNLMVIISDGQDSQAIVQGTSVTEILAGARKAKIPVYFIRVSYNKGLGGVLPDHIWQPAIEATGGRFYAASDESVILRAINDIDRRSTGTIVTKQYSTGQPEFASYAAAAAALWIGALLLQFTVPLFQKFP